MDESVIKKPSSQILPLLLSIFGSISALATTFILAKSLGSEKYGQIQYLLGLINTISYGVSAGLPDFLAKNSQFSSDKKGFFTKCFLISLLATGLCAAIYIPVAFFALSKLEQNWMTISLVFLSGFSVSQVMVCSYFLLGIGKKTFASLFNDFLPRISIFLILLVFVACGLIAAFADDYLVIFSILYSLLAIVLLAFLLRKTNGFLSKNELISILVFFAIGLTSNINGQISKVFQGEMMDYGSTGALSLSAQIMAIASIFTSSVTSLFRPELSKFYHNEENDKLFLLFASLFRVISCFIIPFSIGVMAQSRFLLSRMGEDYSPYFLILIFVACSQGIELLFDPAHTLMAMTDHEKSELLVSLLNFLAFALVSILIGKLSYWGIACGLLCGVLLKNIARFFFMKKTFKAWLLDAKTLIFLLCEAVISFAAFYSLDFLNDNWYKLLADAFAGLVLVVGFFFVDPFKNDRLLFKK